MRRIAVLGLLLLAAVAVALLFLEIGSDGRGRSRRVETTGTVAMPEEATEEEAPGAAAGKASGAAARDDDPNRVAGADLVLRGRVVRDGLGVEGATVLAIRALPAQEYAASRWAMQTFELPPPPIATTLSEAGGGFELAVARRTRLVLRATKPLSGSVALFLLMPAEGDPPEVTLRLRPGGRVEGIVVDEKAVPVRDAEVVLGTQDWSRPATEISARTDEQGRFVVEDAPEGSLRIRARAAGYPEARSWVSVPAQKFVRIELLPAGTIAGKVLDGKGAPVAGARVFLSTSALERAGAGGAATGTTDDQGQYRIEIYPGSVQTAIVEHPRFGRQAAGVGSFDLPTGLVVSGQEMKYDIRLEPGVPVRGRAVYEGTGAPAAGAAVVLLRLAQQWRGMSEVEAVRADEEGRFEFAYVTEGTYALEAKAEKGARLATRYPQANQRVTIDFFVDGETQPPEQRLELVATGSVQGRILGIGESDPYSRPNLYLQIPTGYISGTVDDVGAFVLTNVPVMEDAVLQSNNPQAKSDPFRVEAGKVTDVTLDATKQGITGVVEDEAGRPVARARVGLCPENQIQQQFAQFAQNRGWGGALTDDQGRFSIGAEQWGGDYWKNLKFVAFASREGYATSIGEPFDLPQSGGTSPSLRIVMRKGGFVRGRVEHAGGSPAVNVQVHVSPKQEPRAQRGDLTVPPDTRSSQSAFTGSDGSFEVNGIGDGVYVVSAYHPLGKVEGRDVRAGDDTVKLVIEPALAIAGVVVTESGKPVAAANIAVIVPKERGEQTQNAQTQANGRFRVGQVAAGSYAIEVTPNQQYYGSALGFERKRVENVAAGSEDLRIVVAEGKGLRGKVEDAAGRPVAGAGVIAMPLEVAKPARQADLSGMQWGGSQTQPSAVTNGRGEFEIKGVGSAEVEVLAVAEGHVPATQRAVAGGAPILLRLEEGAVIEGRVLKVDGTPLARHWFWIEPATKEAKARLQDWQQRGGQSWNNLGGWALQSGMTDALGRFRLASLLPGEYKINLQLADEILPTTTLRTGMPSVTLRLERALTIRGRVADAEGRAIALPNGQPVYVNAQRDGQWFSGSMVGSDGRFELRGLSPGVVTLNVYAGKEYKPAKVDVEAGADGVAITLERNPPQPAK